MTLLDYEGFATSQSTGALQTKYEADSIGSLSFGTHPISPLLRMAQMSTSSFFNTYLFANSAVIIIGMRLFMPNNSSTNDIIQIKHGNLIQCRLRPRAGTAANSTKFELVRGGTTGTDGTVLGTSTDIPGSTYIYLELKVTVHETTGAAELRINEAVNFTLAGPINTANAADASNICDNLRFACPSAGAGFIGDIYWLNTTGGGTYGTYLGDVFVEGVLVTADGTTNNFPTQFPASGSHFDKVDDVITSAPDGTTTYVQSTADGQKELYNVSDLQVIAANILAVRAEAYVKLSNTGSRNWHHTYRQGTGGSSGTEADGSTLALTQTGFDPPFSQLWTVNPVTTVAWTVADINAAQFGIETG